MARTRNKTEYVWQLLELAPECNDIEDLIEDKNLKDVLRYWNEGQRYQLALVRFVGNVDDGIIEYNRAYFESSGLAKYFDDTQIEPPQKYRKIAERNRAKIEKLNLVYDV